MRIRRFAMGNPGDVKPVGSGVSEVRIGTLGGWQPELCHDPQGDARAWPKAGAARGIALSNLRLGEVRRVLLGDRLVFDGQSRARAFMR